MGAEESPGKLKGRGAKTRKTRVVKREAYSRRDFRGNAVTYHIHSCCFSITVELKKIDHNSINTSINLPSKPLMHFSLHAFINNIQVFQMVRRFMTRLPNLLMKKRLSQINGRGFSVQFSNICKQTPENR